MQFYKQSEISKMSVYIYKSNQDNIKKCLSFIPTCKRTNLSYFTKTSSPHLTVMLMCLHPSTVKYTLEFSPAFSSLRVTANRPVRPAPFLLTLHLLLVVTLLVPTLSLVSRYRGLHISRYYRVDYLFGVTVIWWPFVNLDNRFADVLATESVVEDSHDFSKGFLSPVIGEMSSIQCSGWLLFWCLTNQMTLLWIWLMKFLMLTYVLVFVAPLLV